MSKRMSEPCSFTICLLCFLRGSLREGLQVRGGKWAWALTGCEYSSSSVLSTLYMVWDCSDVFWAQSCWNFHCSGSAGVLWHPVACIWNVLRSTAVTSEAGGFIVLACEREIWKMHCCSANKESCHPQHLLWGWWTLQSVCLLDY